MVDQHMGDFVLALPTIFRLAEHFENGIDLYVAKHHVPLAELVPNVRQVVAYQHTRKTRKSYKQLFSFIGMLAKLPLKRYQAAYFIRARITESTFALFTLSPRRITTSSARRQAAYNRVVEEPPFEKHEMKLMASVLQTIGQTEPPAPIRLQAPERDYRLMETTLHANGVEPGQKLAVIHPTSGLPQKCWPKDRFAYVADALTECNMKVCFIGSSGDREYADELMAMMKNPDDAFFLAHKLTVLLALFQRADLLFSNESGPTHLAATTGIPIVTVFGPTDPDRWKPMREENLTLLSKRELCKCPDPRYCDYDWPCIKKITVEEALHALEECI